jgi:large subunit ribosomal protein L9
MRVLLIKDVYKLGRAGDIKKVADGYGRNYLLPQNLAVLATPGAVKQADRIRQSATIERARQNQELGAVAERLEGLRLVFPVKAGETGKLYGSITSLMIGEAIERQTGIKIDRRQVDSQPVKTLGLHRAHIRLTIDLVPEISLVVHREGESPESALEKPAAEIETEDFAELQQSLDAEAARKEAEGQAELDDAASMDEPLDAE